MGIIAANAQPILDARKKELKPVDLILVSLIGRVNEANHTVYADPQKHYEWVWVRGLKICIYADRKSIWRDTAFAIASQQPSWLALWDADRHEGANVSLLPLLEDIEKPKEQWRWKLDFLPWHPIENQEFAWN